MDREVGAVEFLFRIEPQRDHRPEPTVDDVAAGHGDRHPRQRADDLRAERDAAEAPERLGAEDAGRKPVRTFSPP